MLISVQCYFQSYQRAADHVQHIYHYYVLVQIDLRGASGVWPWLSAREHQRVFSSASLSCHLFLTLFF